MQQPQYCGYFAAMIHLGRDLKLVIEQRGLKKREVAQQLGLTEPTFYRILQKKHLSTKLLLRFCEILEVHPASFFTRYNGPGAEKLKTMQEYPAGKEVLLSKLLTITQSEPLSLSLKNEMLEQRVADLQKQRGLLEDHLESLKKVAGVKG